MNVCEPILAKFLVFKIFLGKKGEQNEYMEFKIGDRA